MQSDENESLTNSHAVFRNFLYVIFRACIMTLAVIILWEIDCNQELNDIFWIFLEDRIWSAVLHSSTMEADFKEVIYSRNKFYLNKLLKIVQCAKMLLLLSQFVKKELKSRHSKNCINFTAKYMKCSIYCWVYMSLSPKLFSDFFSLMTVSNERQLVLHIVWVRRLFRRWDNSFPCTLGILVGDQFVSVSKLCPISANNQTTYMPFGFPCLLGVNTISHLPAVAAASVLTHSPFGQAGHMTVSLTHSLAFYTPRCCMCSTSHAMAVNHFPSECSWPRKVAVTHAASRWALLIL